MKHKTLRKLIQDSRFKIQERGFTIVEVLVTSLIFSMIVISVSAIFIQVIGIERRGFAVQKVQDNALFVLEMMSRDIRVSRISNQESPNCSLGILTMTHPSKGAITYRSDGGAVLKSENGKVEVQINDGRVDFSGMRFCVVGSDTNDNQTPRVTIVMSVGGLRSLQKFPIDLQTTVSSRDTFNEFQNP